VSLIFSFSKGDKLATKTPKDFSENIWPTWKGCRRSRDWKNGIKIDMAAKRHKKHKNKISDLVISVGYNE
jgi:hypothetical protein